MTVTLACQALQTLWKQRHSQSCGAPTYLDFDQSVHTREDSCLESFHVDLSVHVYISGDLVLQLQCEKEPVVVFRLPWWPLAVI